MLVAIPFLLVFFLSGATGLVYEVLWTRQLALIFGVTTYAVSTVLATYMGGLALGSYVMGRRVDHVRNPLLLYAVLEAAIGLYALLVPMLFEALRPLYVGLAHLELSYPVFSLARSVMAVLVLLIPTALMGGTFPVLVRQWVRLGGGMQSGTGVLYFVNTAGAIAGCSMAGFYLIERFGLTGTNYIAAFTNLGLALLAALIARSKSWSPEAVAETKQKTGFAPLPSGTASLILFCSGLSGFIALSAQVLWSRALLRYLYNSTYAFTAMLTVFLVGIVLGSALFTGLLAHRKRPLLWMALLQAAVGAGFAVSVLMLPRIPELTIRIFGSDIVDSFETSVVMMLTKAAIILLPPVVFLGAIFPMTTVLYATGRKDLGNAVGRAYAANTFGAIVGSISCAFVLIPWLGMWGTHKLLVILSLLGAGAVAASAMTAPRARAVAALSSVAIAAAATLAAPADVFRSTFLANPGQKLEFYAEGPTDTVGVSSAYGQRTIVYEDQRGTASTASFGVNLFLGHLPMMLHPGTPKTVLHICFGVGNSLSAVVAHPELERVDSVELSPHVLDAGRLFWSNDGVVDHPKVRHVIDDGRNYLMTTSETYDVILLEPPETFTAGVINLYTTQFYRDAMARLADDGVMMQWIPTANGPIEGEKELFRAFHDVFPYSTMWWQLDGGCALLIGSKNQITIDYQKLAAHFEEGRVKQDMLLSQVRSVDHLLSFFVFDEKAFADFVAGAQPTTDDLTMLDFSMPRYAGSGFGLGQFNSKVVGEGGRNPFLLANQRRSEYLSLRRPVLPYLTNTGPDTPEAIGARIEQSRDLPFVRRFFQEAEWKKMRADGSIPDMTARKPALRQ
jgi:spermidine synthase